MESNQVHHFLFFNLHTLLMKLWYSQFLYWCPGVELLEKDPSLPTAYAWSLVGKPVRNFHCHPTGSSFFWIIHKYHVVGLKHHQRLVFVVICNYSAMSVVSVSVSQKVLQGPVY